MLRFKIQNLCTPSSVVTKTFVRVLFIDVGAHNQANENFMIITRYSTVQFVFCSTILQGCPEDMLLGAPQHELWHLPSAPSNAMALLYTLHHQMFLSWAVHTVAVLCLLALYTVNNTRCIICPRMHACAYQDSSICSVMQSTCMTKRWW